MVTIPNDKAYTHDYIVLYGLGKPHQVRTSCVNAD